MKLNNKNKLLCSILSLLVLGLLASALVAYLHISSAQRQALQNEHLVKARATTEKLTHWLSENLAIVSHYADVIAEHPLGLYDNPALQDYLSQSTATGRFDYISYSLESDGYMWINDWEIPQGYNPRLRPWYISSKQAMRPTIPEPYLSVDADPHRYLAVTAPLLRDGHFIGMVLGDVPMEFVKNTVMDTRLDFNGEVFITNHQGKILIHKNEQMEGLSQQTLLGKTFRPAAKTLRNPSALTCSKPAIHRSWKRKITYIRFHQSAWPAGNWCWPSRRAFSINNCSDRPLICSVHLWVFS
ncbi:cache domain-containing protein [Aliamphritea spongicola]|nr:cache domain-containing protein [Aliamphritea spongicola]